MKIKTYDCPSCGDNIKIPSDCLSDKNEDCCCSNCGVEFTIDYDAEFEDGMWRDRTKLFFRNIS